MFKFEAKEMASVLLGGSALLGSMGLHTEQSDSTEVVSIAAEERGEEVELSAKLGEIMKQDQNHAAEVAAEMQDLRNQSFLLERSSQESLAAVFRGKEELEQHGQVLENQEEHVTELTEKKDTLQSRVKDLETVIGKTQKATASESKLLEREEERTRALVKDAGRLQEIVENRQERVENLQTRKQDLERRLAKKRAEEKAAKKRYEKRRQSGEIGSDRH
jgi:chromosome segregation ATPase